VKRTAPNASRFLPVSLLVLVFLSTCQYAGADVCVYKPPTVQRVCGIIVDPDGRPISGVQVTVSKDGAIVKEHQTDDIGAFDFDQIASGKYEIDLSASGFAPASYQLTLSKPISSCKRALRVEMIISGIHCGGDIRKTNKPLAR
jgi:hypothetical protein